jgi:uncharacterized LabA/DUF88 family protein
MDQTIYTDGQQRPRVAIFIDGSNLYHALEDNCQRTDLDYGAFTQKLAAGRPLYRIYYYNIRQDEKRRPKESSDQQRFLNVLYSVPYLEVRLGITREHQGVTVEKGVDIMLATDVLQYAWNNLYDTAIVVSGDADFTYALQTAKNLGKYIEIASFESNQSPEMVQVADCLHALTAEYFTDLWYTSGDAAKKKRRRRPTRRPRVSSSEAA